MKRAVLLLFVACGDNRPEVEVFEPTNGARLMIEQYQLGDGTRIVQPTAFYDRELHARCTPQPWIDGVLRCVPDAEEAFYRDAACETAFGRAVEIDFPTHFIARDSVVFPAGAKTDPIAGHYLREGELCTGPHVFEQPEPDGTQYYEVEAGFDGNGLVAMSESELGDGRLGLVVRQSDDGALVPLGFRDRVIDAACRPVASGGREICEPTSATASEVFADSECTRPAILVEDSELPTVARTTDTEGCPVFRAVLDETIPRAYRETSAGCVSAITTGRVIPLGPALELAAVARDVETVAKRRVQRILASEGDLHVYSDRMFDSATGSECELRAVGKQVRCLPTSLAPIARLFHPGCTVERRVAEVSQKSCEPFAFAVNDTGETLELHAIGDRLDATAFALSGNGECLPYAPPAGRELYQVGPVLPDDTFVVAVPFGAR